MLYGDQKSRQMARSILPSTSRFAARARARIHRTARRETAYTLRLLTRDHEAWEDGVDFGEAAWRELPTVISDRRSADKLNHFMRWAAARTRKLAVTERLDTLRSTLPDGLIGEHALSHLERDRRIAPPKPGELPWRRHSRFLDRGLMATLLRALLDEADGVRWLYRCLKTASRSQHARRVTPGPHRLLGRPQVLPFLDAVAKDRVAHFVVSDFCCVYQRTHAAQRAAVAAAACVELPTFDWFYDRG